MTDLAFQYDARAGAIMAMPGGAIICQCVDPRSLGDCKLVAPCEEVVRLVNKVIGSEVLALSHDGKKITVLKSDSQSSTMTIATVQPRSAAGVSATVQGEAEFPKMLNAVFEDTKFGCCLDPGGQSMHGPQYGWITYEGGLMCRLTNPRRAGCHLDGLKIENRTLTADMLAALLTFVRGEVIRSGGLAACQHRCKEAACSVDPQLSQPPTYSRGCCVIM